MSKGKHREGYVRLSIYTDGASKGNPGPGGAGAVLQLQTGQRKAWAQGMGHTTNNEAEYTAMLLGIRKAKEAGATHVRAYTDAELVVHQLNGTWKINNPNLRAIRDEIILEAEAFEVCVFAHVFREDNAAADRAANLGVALAKGEVHDVTATINARGLV